MKICITSLGNSLESEIDPRFGRCAQFIIVKTESLNFEVIQNTNAGSGGGAGIGAGQMISDMGVKAVLTGNIGPNAWKTLKAAGIDVFIGLSGKIKDAVMKYKNGELTPASSPNSESHAGMK